MSCVAVQLLDLLQPECGVGHWGGFLKNHTKPIWVSREAVCLNGVELWNGSLPSWYQIGLKKDQSFPGEKTTRSPAGGGKQPTE